MARLPRLVAPHQPHHLIQCGHDGTTIFRDEEDYRAFLRWLREGARVFGVAVHAYVLMPDHVHLLATPRDAGGLARMMQWLGRHYVPYFNARHDRRGTLWQGRYRAVVLEPEPYLLAFSRYIELNPVRAQFVSDPAAYPWSSYAHHAGLRPDSLITDHAAYWALGNTPFDREAAYRRLFETDGPASEAEAFTTATWKGWPIGSEQFKSRIAQETGKRTVPAPRGRPARGQGRTA